MSDYYIYTQAEAEELKIENDKLRDIIKDVAEQIEFFDPKYSRKLRELIK